MMGRSPLDVAMDRCRERAQREQACVWVKPWHIIAWRLFLSPIGLLAHWIAEVCWSVIFLKRVRLEKSWEGEL